MIRIIGFVAIVVVAKCCDEYVCVGRCVCLSAKISSRSLPNFCACCLWPWLGPPPTSLRYVMYFRFCGWHHFLFYSGPYSDLNLMKSWHWQEQQKQGSHRYQISSVVCDPKIAHHEWNLISMIAFLLLLLSTFYRCRRCQLREYCAPERNNFYNSWQTSDNVSRDGRRNISKPRNINSYCIILFWPELNPGVTLLYSSLPIHLEKSQQRVWVDASQLLKWYRYRVEFYESVSVSDPHYIGSS